MATMEMSFRIRTSKFRHVFGKAARKEHCYENIRLSRSAHDGCFCAVNPKFIAIVTESSSGGSFIVLPIEKTGRMDPNTPKVCGHRGAIMDLKWSPFNDYTIASCSEDSTVKIWQIPEGGLTMNLADCVVDLHGHQKRVAYIEWHPTAANIILSASYDFQCILWNTETAEPINIISCHTDTIFSISWNRDGSLFATTSKDKRLRVIDPRSGEVAAEAHGFQGPKASKVVFLGNTNRLFVVGFTRSSDRQYAIWNIKDMSKPLRQETIDCSSGLLSPYFDPDTNVVFVVGKGDGNIRYFEIVEEAPYCHFLSQYLSPDPQRGVGLLPKRGLDTSKNEIMRFYKLHASKELCEVISMIVPRRSEEFQDDIYPPTASATPSLTANEWISGQNRDPILVSLRDGSCLSLPKITTSKAIQRKELSQGPSISTYKTVKRGLNEPAQEVKVTKKQSSIQDDEAPPVPPLPSEENLPASLKNIRKLSSAETSPKKQVSYSNGVSHETVNSSSSSYVTTSSSNTEKTSASADSLDRKLSFPSTLAFNYDSKSSLLSNKDSEQNNNTKPSSTSCVLQDISTTQLSPTKGSSFLNTSVASVNPSVESMTPSSASVNLPQESSDMSVKPSVASVNQSEVSMVPSSASVKLSATKWESIETVDLKLSSKSDLDASWEMNLKSKSSESYSKNMSPTRKSRSNQETVKSPEYSTPPTSPWLDNSSIEIIETSPSVRDMVAEKKALEKPSPSNTNQEEDSSYTPLVKPSDVIAKQKHHFLANKESSESLGKFTEPNTDDLLRHSSSCSLGKTSSSQAKTMYLDLNLERSADAPDTTPPDRVHVRKIWSPTKSPDYSFSQNGMPRTDPELRKAYFQQVEEIKMLKQQLTMKDKRIRQLEEEISELRTGEIGNSTC